MENKLQTLANLYQHLDGLFDQNVDADTLFASSYLRGLISLAATVFGDEQQEVSSALQAAVTEQLAQAKSELSPQDNAIVQNFWSQLQEQINH